MLMWDSARTATPETPPFGSNRCRWICSNVAPAAATLSRSARSIASSLSSAWASHRSRMRCRPTKPTRSTGAGGGTPDGTARRLNSGILVLLDFDCGRSSDAERLRRPWHGTDCQPDLDGFPVEDDATRLRLVRN